MKWDSKLLSHGDDSKQPRAEHTSTYDSHWPHTGHRRRRLQICCTTYVMYALLRKHGARRRCVREAQRQPQHSPGVQHTKRPPLPLSHNPPFHLQHVPAIARSQTSTRTRSACAVPESRRCSSSTTCDSIEDRSCSPPSKRPQTRQESNQRRYTLFLKLNGHHLTTHTTHVPLGRSHGNSSWRT